MANLNNSRRRASAPRFEDLEGRLVLSSVAPLVSDAVAVQKAFATFDVSYQQAVTALRQTATTKTAPTAAGLTAFDNAVAGAITTLDRSIAADLSNLPNTGPGLIATIDGYTSTLQTNLDQAGARLANSTNSAVNALYRDSFRYVATADNQAIRAILSDTAPASITPTSYATATRSVFGAYQVFNSSIATATRTAIAAGKPLDGTAVANAVSALQSSVDSAVAGLGSGLAASPYNPTPAINATLSNLTGSLTSIAAPSATNRGSALRFLYQVGSTVFKAQASVTQTLTTAVANYNHNLL